MRFACYFFIYIFLDKKRCGVNQRKEREQPRGGAVGRTPSQKKKRIITKMDGKPLSNYQMFAWYFE